MPSIPPTTLRAAAAVVTLVSLAACATPRLRPAPETSAATGVMRPYEVGGHWYRPAEQPRYNAVGYASWYGANYHCRSTADGELLDPGALTGAHKTLPLPSMVEVTNLENGRRTVVRLNDRGPFVEGRIIDLTPAAARKLGFYSQGLAKVRVRYLGPAPRTSRSDAC